MPLLFLALAACYWIPKPGVDGESGADLDSNHESDADTDADSDADTDADTDTDPGPDPDLPITSELGGILLLPMATGTFAMGCTTGQGSDCNEDEVLHDVTITQRFWLGEFEISQDQWESVTGETPSSFQADCGGPCPVEQVSWHDAAAFANTLSVAEGLSSCFTCSGGECETLAHATECTGYRFPTEAEWEYAARCDTDLRYAGNNDSQAVAWTQDNELDPVGETHPSGLLDANACGLYDMSGNVWEWVGDWYDAYGTGPVSDPDGPAAGDHRVSRGGGWNYPEDGARVAFREYKTPQTRDARTGFRLARSVR